MAHVKVYLESETTETLMRNVCDVIVYCVMTVITVMEWNTGITDESNH